MHTERETNPDRTVDRVHYFFSYGKERSQLFFAETFGTYHVMGFCTLAPGGTRFQLHRPIIGMVGVDVTPGKAPNYIPF